MASNKNSLIEINDKRVKILITAITYLYFFGYGFGLSLNSSAWLDLTEMVSSNQKSMAYVITSSFVGVSVGALSAFLISDKNRQFAFIALMVTKSVCYVFIPLHHHISLLHIILFIVGFINGLAESLSQSWLLQIWSRNGPFLQAFHLCFSVGAIFGPIVCAPFLVNSDSSISTESTFSTDSITDSTTDSISNLITGSITDSITDLITNSISDLNTDLIDESITNLINDSNTHSFTDFNTDSITEFKNYSVSSIPSNYSLLLERTLSTLPANTTSYPIEHEIESQIWLPYSISASFFAISALLTFVLFGCQRRNHNIFEVVHDLRDHSRDKVHEAVTSIDKSLEPDEDSPIVRRRSFSKLVVFVTICAFILSLEVGLEVIVPQYIPTFAVALPLGIDKVTAAYIRSSQAASLAIGRLLAIFLSLRLPPEALITANYALVLIASLFLYFFVEQCIYVVWAAFVVFGLGLASTFPGMISYAEKRISVTNSVSGVLIFSTGGASWLLPIVVGQYIESHPMILTYLMLVLICAQIAFFILLHLVARNWNLKQ